VDGMSIIYIMGAGRSGTTLVDIVLGNGKKIFSCGEILKFFSLRGVPHGFSEDTKIFQFWKRVEKIFFLRNHDTYEELSDLTKSFESHSSFFFTMFGLHSKAKKLRYKNTMQNLFESISEESGRSIFIDSSKYPGRLIALSRCLSHKIHVIHIKRDPVFVVRSFLKKNIEQPSKNLISANIYYFIISFFCFIVKKMITNVDFIEIKYEDFISTPQSVLKNISNEFDIDLSYIAKKINDNDELSVGYLFEGNRIRLKSSLKLINSDSTLKKDFTYYFTRLFNLPWYIP